MPTLKVFEHQVVRAGDQLLFYTGKSPIEKELDEKYITALWKMYDEKHRPFFTPTRGGIKFCEFVGVIKILDLTIEILPKADNNKDWSSEGQHEKWQSILINMLRVCRKLSTPSVSDAALKLKSNSILDLYIERFINEVSYLINVGLIKRYRKEEVNSTALKGKLLLQKHITKNLVHKERFYVAKSSYDKDHVLHQIIFKAIKILPLLCNHQALLSSCYQLQLNFPEVSDIRVDESTFMNLHLDRKSTSYATVIEIAKLLLLNYRPDVSSGSNHSIAILFNMNTLWEEYIYRMLLKANDGNYTFHNQKSAHFWSSNGKNNRYLKPDIVIESEGRRVVVDTKWKNLYNDVKNVSMDDLRQMYAYNHYFKAERCYLLYPGFNDPTEGRYAIKTFRNESDLEEKSCGVILSKAWKEDNSYGSYLNQNIGEEILEIVFRQIHVE